MKGKKPFYKRWWFWVIIIIVISRSFSGDKKSKDKAIKDNALEVSKNDNLEITGDMNIKIVDDKIVATINSNAVDGSIFEVIAMSNNFDLVSEMIEIKDGKIEKEFTIPKEWEIGYVIGTADLRFNIESHPQPEHVMELYGKNGENLKGSLVKKSKFKEISTYSIEIESNKIGYPSDEAVITQQKELFESAMNELMKGLDGAVTSIKPHIEGKGWDSTRVVVSDIWYNSADYEKERFAEQVGEAIQNIIINTGQVKEDSNVMVWFYDAYDKELASPKVLGGYKIKR